MLLLTWALTDTRWIENGSLANITFFISSTGLRNQRELCSIINCLSFPIQFSSSTTTSRIHTSMITSSRSHCPELTWNRRLQKWFLTKRRRKSKSVSSRCWFKLVLNICDYSLVLVQILDVNLFLSCRIQEHYL